METYTIEVEKMKMLQILFYFFKQWKLSKLVTFKLIIIVVCELPAFVSYMNFNYFCR